MMSLRFSQNARVYLKIISYWLSYYKTQSDLSFGSVDYELLHVDQKLAAYRIYIGLLF